MKIKEFRDTISAKAVDTKTLKRSNSNLAGEETIQTFKELFKDELMTPITSRSILRKQNSIAEEKYNDSSNDSSKEVKKAIEVR